MRTVFLEPADCRRPVPSYPLLSLLDKAVADPVDSQHVLRLLGFRLDLLPEVLDVRVDGPFVPLKGIALHPVQQFETGEHAARMPGQDSQQVELGRRQFHSLSTPR